MGGSASATRADLVVAPDPEVTRSHTTATMARQPPPLRIEIPRGLTQWLHDDSDSSEGDDATDDAHLHPGHPDAYLEQEEKLGGANHWSPARAPMQDALLDVEAYYASIPVSRGPEVHNGQTVVEPTEVAGCASLQSCSSKHAVHSLASPEPADESALATPSVRTTKESHRQRIRSHEVPLQRSVVSAGPAQLSPLARQLMIAQLRRRSFEN